MLPTTPSRGAERLIRSFISAIDGLDVDQIMDGSDKCALRFNLSRPYRNERSDAAWRRSAW